MRLSFDDLPKHLRQSLKPLYVVSGDEPMQLLDARDRIVEAAKRHGFAAHRQLDLATSLSDDEWQQAFAGGGLFAEKSLVEIRCPKHPDKANQARLINVLDKHLDDTCVLLMVPKVDNRIEKLAWFRRCLEIGAWISVWPVDATELPAWLQRRAIERARSLSSEAAGRMAELVEGNLLSARQALALLCFVTKDGETIDVDKVEEFVANNARFSPWQAIDLALAGKSERIPPLVWRIAAVDDPKMLMARALQNLFAQLDQLSRMSIGQRRKNYPGLRIWSKRQVLFESALQRHPPTAWNKLWVRSLHLEYMVTGRLAGDFWDACLDLLLLLSGTRLRLPYREIES